MSGLDASAVEAARKAFVDVLTIRYGWRDRLGQIEVQHIREAIRAAIEAYLLHTS
jgi:hypothetical protein